MPFRIVALILFTVSLSACAQLVLKLGMTGAAMAKAMQSGLGEMLKAALSSPYIWFGLGLYGVGVVLWLWVLSKVDLSVAYPFVGVSFLITMLFGVLLLNENVTPLRIVGTLLIAVGCILVGRSA